MVGRTSRDRSDPARRVRKRGGHHLVAWLKGPVEYRVEPHAAKLGGRHRSSVVELSIRNPARPAHTSAGRCVFNKLHEASDDEHSPETCSLPPPLAPRWQGDAERARASRQASESFLMAQCGG